MSDDPMAVTDEELTAYLDGVLSEKDYARVAAAVAAEPALQGRLDALRLPGGLMSAAYDLSAMGAPQMPAALQEKMAQAQLIQSDAAMPPVAGVAPVVPPVHAANTNTAPRLLWPVALAASFALGMVAMSIMRPAEPEQVAAAKPGWVATVASYQSLYTTETLSGSPQDPAASQAILARAETELGVDLSGALNIEGLTFKRVQLLAIDGAPLIQMAYLDAQGQPFAFCLTMRDAEDRGNKTGMSWDLATSSWIEDGVGYVLVGGQDTDRVGEIAARFQSVI